MSHLKALLPKGHIETLESVAGNRGWFITSRIRHVTASALAALKELDNQLFEARKKLKEAEQKVHDQKKLVKDVADATQRAATADHRCKLAEKDATTLQGRVEALAKDNGNARGLERKVLELEQANAALELEAETLRAENRRVVAAAKDQHELFSSLDYGKKTAENNLRDERAGHADTIKARAKAEGQLAEANDRISVFHSQLAEAEESEQRAKREAKETIVRLKFNEDALREKIRESLSKTFESLHAVLDGKLESLFEGIT